MLTNTQVFLIIVAASVVGEERKIKNILKPIPSCAATTQGQEAICSSRYQAIIHSSLEYY
jgi:hypothetical protein